MGYADLMIRSKLYKGFETLIELQCGILYIFVEGRLIEFCCEMLTNSAYNRRK